MKASERRAAKKARPGNNALELISFHAEWKFSRLRNNKGRRTALGWGNNGVVDRDQIILH